MKLYEKAVGIEWRTWFAWYPVTTIDFKVVWLEEVERKIFNCPIPNVSPSDWTIYRRNQFKKANPQPQ